MILGIKARICANGDLTDVPNESVYSGVVSLKNLHIFKFLVELNDLEVYAIDIGNAYLEYKTSEEKIYVTHPACG